MLQRLLGLLLGLMLISVVSFGQCSNQIRITYFDNTGVERFQTINNGQSGASVATCPTAGGLYNLRARSTTDGFISWAKVITKGNIPNNDVVETFSSSPLLAGGTDFPVSVAFTTSTLFRVEAAGAGGGGCGKQGYAYMTFTPALTLASNVTGVCPGGSATLTAGGSTSGTYSWSANGVTIPNQTGNTITVSPTEATTYKVTTATSCGTSSQQITLAINGITVTPSEPVICAGQVTALTASYTGTGATYQWFVKGATTSFASGATISVSPTATTTYRVDAAGTGCRGISKEVTVTVGASSVSVAPTAATICPGGSTSLKATSTNPSATYSWSPATGLNTTTGATVVANPTTNTTYTVTATTPSCGTTTSTVAVNVAPATFATVAPATTCSGTETTLTTVSNITGATYAWYRTSDMGTTLSTASTLTVAPTATTTYRVVTTTGSCGSNTQDATVTVNAAPAVAVTPASASMASGTATTLTASGANTYSWSPATGLNTTTGPTVTARPTVTTTYTVTGTNTTTGCTNTRQVTLTVTRSLPVKLIGFDAAWAGNSPLLTWATASEQNSAYFEVERSLNGVAFTALGRIAGQGTKATTTNYTYRDANLSTQVSTVYYRLRQVDLDGTATYSPVRTVALGSVAIGLEVSPNPTHSAAKLIGAEAGASVQVFNGVGQLVLTTQADAAGAAALVMPAGLRNGLYLVRSGGRVVRLIVSE